MLWSADNTEDVPKGTQSRQRYVPRRMLGEAWGDRRSTRWAQVSMPQQGPARMWCRKAQIGRSATQGISSIGDVTVAQGRQARSDSAGICSRIHGGAWTGQAVNAAPAPLFLEAVVERLDGVPPPTCTARAAFVRGKGNRRTPKKTRAKGMRPARTSLLAFSSSLRAAARMRTSFAVSSGPSPISSRMAKPCPAGVSRSGCVLSCRGSH